MNIQDLTQHMTSMDNAWQAFVSRALRGRSKEEVDKAQRMFYAGATAFLAIQTKLCHDIKDEAEFADKMNAVAKELSDFSIEHLAKELDNMVATFKAKGL